MGGECGDGGKVKRSCRWQVHEESLGYRITQLKSAKRVQARLLHALLDQGIAGVSHSQIRFVRQMCNISLDS